VGAAVLTSPQTVAVTAIDADELESPRSGALELRLAAPAK
jgi:hypothetical protein